MFKELRAWKNWREINALDEKDRQIVFYSESHHYWTHFEPIISSLISDHDLPICYLTSDENDPILFKKIPGVKVFWIGEGFLRTFLFRQLNAKVMVLSMPDLESFYLKRSQYPIHYVYVFHSLVSTHRVYNHAAFDHYDTILCCGPHHEEEIRHNEHLYDLKPKTLVAHGYGRLDSIISKKQTNIANPRKILIAPSWGQENIITICGSELIQVLLASGFEVVFRPHPQSCKHQKKSIRAILKNFQGNANFHYEENMNATRSLQESAVMISDWSGAALDYAFGLLKPVLFIDVPPKIHNKRYAEQQKPVLEDYLRKELGGVVTPAEISQVSHRISQLLENTSWPEKIEKLRQKHIYNLGTSGAVAAKYLSCLVRNVSYETSNLQADTEKRLQA